MRSRCRVTRPLQNHANEKCVSRACQQVRQLLRHTTVAAGPREIDRPPDHGTFREAAPRSDNSIPLPLDRPVDSRSYPRLAESGLTPGMTALLSRRFADDSTSYNAEIPDSAGSNDSLSIQTKPINLLSSFPAAKRPSLRRHALGAKTPQNCGFVQASIHPDGSIR